MTPAASPRHPFKALAVVLMAFVLVHGAWAHVEHAGHDATHIRLAHGGIDLRDCPDGDVDIDIDVDDRDPDDGPVIDVFDDDEWR